MPTDLSNKMSKIKKHIFNKYPRYFNNLDEAEILYLDKKMVNNTLSQLDITLPDLLDFEHKELVVMPPSENMLYLMHSPSYEEMDEEHRQQFEQDMEAELEHFAKDFNVTEEKRTELRNNFIKTIGQGTYYLYHFNRSLMENRKLKFNTFEYYPATEEFRYIFGSEFSIVELTVKENKIRPELDIRKFAFSKYALENIIKDSDVTLFIKNNAKSGDPFFPEGYVETITNDMPAKLFAEIQRHMKESTHDLFFPNAIINTKIFLKVEETQKLTAKEHNRLEKTKHKKPYLMPQSIKHIIDIDMFNKTVIDKANRLSGTGSQKSPHYRRGHIRRLQSGKLTFVRPSFVGAKKEYNIGKKIYRLKT